MKVIDTNTANTIRDAITYSIVSLSFNGVPQNQIGEAERVWVRKMVDSLFPAFLQSYGLVEVPYSM